MDCVWCVCGESVLNGCGSFYDFLLLSSSALHDFIDREKTGQEEQWMGNNATDFVESKQRIPVVHSLTTDE